jgi:SAM-dependent methyltransferase
MKSPWLAIPLEDYEQHMALPCVGQSELMSDAIAEALDQHQPRSLVIAGCAGGNGLERVIGANVRPVIGIDINESYVQSAQQRFGDRIPGLRLIVGDIETTQFDFEPVDLVFAGLLFEYVDSTRALRNIRSMLLPGGVLKAVLQLPGQVATVTPSPYRSLELLSPILRLVPPDRFASDAAESGFSLLSCQTVATKGGKLFAVQCLRVNDV